VICLLKGLKGQTSIEVIAILGVLVVGAIILGSFYLSNINKKVDTATDLSNNTTDDITNWLNTGNSGSPNSLYCGDGICNNGEICYNPILNTGCVPDCGECPYCEVPADCGTPGSDCLEYDCVNNMCISNNVDNGTACSGANTDCMDYVCSNGFCISGTDTCPPGEFCSGPAPGSCETDCEAAATNGDCDTNPAVCAGCSTQCGECCGDGECNNGEVAITCPEDCSGGNTANLNLVPNNAIGYVDIDYSDLLLTLVMNDSESVDVSVSVTDSLLGTSSEACSIDGTNIPAIGLSLDSFTENYSDYKVLNCSETGTFVFTFDGVDNLSNTLNPRLFTFTVTDQPNTIYALCSEETTTTAGTFSFCVNKFESSTTNTNGSLTIYVNQPDNTEHTGSNCTSNANGSLCIYVGQTI